MAAALGACSDSTGLDPDDIAGTWVASVRVFTNPANTSQTADIMALGGSFMLVLNADGSFITELTGDATLPKWGRERLELDPGMMRGRDRAQGLQEREELFNGPIAVEVDEEGRIFVVETARQRLQVYRKQVASFHGGPL